MKYEDFKIFKFSTISKNINRIRDSFSRIHKNIKNIPRNIANFLSNILKFIFSKINKNIKFLIRSIFSAIKNGIEFIIYDFVKIHKLENLRKLDFKKAYKYLDIRRYDFYKINKKVNLGNYKNIPVYFASIVIFAGFVYLAVPKFYSYDKLKIAKVICENKNVNCVIKGKVNYNFFPTPRIKIKNLVINDSTKKNIIVTAEDVALKISINNLLFKEKQKFNKIKLNKFKINLDLKNLKKYGKIFTKKNNLIPITFSKGQIIFLDKKDYVATINSANLNLEFVQDSIEATLEGKFLGDTIYFNLKNKKVKNKLFTDILLKMSDTRLLAEINFVNSEKNKNIKDGNFLIKSGKSSISAVFDYKDNELKINKSNLRNTFLDGKLEGKIKLLPYFDFNLDLNLNSINFTKLYNYFLALDEKEQKKLFRINNKINGKLNFSSERIYSSYNLVKSMESRIQFRNGNILIEQFLINMGKLGASDLLGTINNEKKFTNFRFESNIFIDNQKKFLSKFGIFNIKSLASNFFISGNFDLENLRTSFYEITGKEKIANDDVDFIEQEFNDIMFENGFRSLFLFPKIKEFLKSINSENN